MTYQEQRAAHPGFVQIRCPVEARSLPSLWPGCKRIQLEPAYSRSSPSKPSDRDFQILSDYLVSHPSVVFRLYGTYTVESLEFLRFFSHHRRFEFDLFFLENFEGLRHLSEDLEAFYLGATKVRIDLSFLRRFKTLKELHLEGHRKAIESISALTSLEYLSLRSITLPNLALLLPLQRLLDLEIRLGGTKNLEPLGEIGKLRYLHLWLIKGLTDLSPIGEIKTLQNLFLQALRNVALLPNLAACHVLRRIVLYQMKGILDLSRLAAAPALRELAVLSMPQLDSEALYPLAVSRSLERVDIFLRSKKKYAEVKRALGDRLSDNQGEFSTLLTGSFDYE